MRILGIFVIGVASGILLPIYDFNQHVFHGKNLLAVIGCLSAVLAMVVTKVQHLEDKNL